MAKQDVKIVYCFNELKEPMFYMDCIKGEKYYCVDCSEELVVRDGNVKIKHLSHKINCGCESTGESIFHKHYKENMFKKGLFLKFGNLEYEIYNVLNEVYLKTRYNKNWDRDIIVDTLLETSGGDIIIEIHKTNKKDWYELHPYYDDLFKSNNITNAYEVSISKYVNELQKWNEIYELIFKAKRKHELKLKREEDNRMASFPKKVEFIVNPFSWHKYNASTDLTLVSGILVDNHYNRRCKKILYLGGDFTKRLSHSSFIDKKVWNLMSDYSKVIPDIKIKDGYLYLHKEYINKYSGLMRELGIRYNKGVTGYDLRNTVLEKLCYNFIITFEYTGVCLDDYTTITNFEIKAEHNWINTKN